MTNYERRKNSGVNKHYWIDRTIGGLLSVVIPVAFAAGAFLLVDFIICCVKDGVCTYAQCW